MEFYKFSKITYEEVDFNTLVKYTNPQILNFNPYVKYLLSRNISLVYNSLLKGYY